MRKKGSDRLKRKYEIYEYIIEKQEIGIAELATDFAVSEMTIRRDLLDLEEQGLITVNRGRINLNMGTALELSSRMKTSKMAAEKERIAERAKEFIQEGSTIYLDSGTTVQRLAQELLEYKNLTVVTGSLLVINALCMVSNIKVLMLPGILNCCGMAAYDVSTYCYMEDINVDAAFMGAEAVDIKNGVMVPEITDKECKKLMIANSRQRVLLADSSKIFKKSMFTYAGFQDIDIFITDGKYKGISGQELQDYKTRVIVV